MERSLAVWEGRSFGIVSHYPPPVCAHGAGWGWGSRFFVCLSFYLLFFWSHSCLSLCFPLSWRRKPKIQALVRGEGQEPLLWAFPISHCVSTWTHMGWCHLACVTLAELGTRKSLICLEAGTSVNIKLTFKKKKSQKGWTDQFLDK